MEVMWDPAMTKEDKFDKKDKVSNLLVKNISQSTCSWRAVMISATLWKRETMEDKFDKKDKVSNLLVKNISR